MKKFIQSIIHFLDRLGEDKVSVYAAYATLFIIISVFPFTMLLLTLLQFLPLSEEYLINMVSKLMPETLMPLANSIIQDLYGKVNGTFISVTAITAFWSASSGVFGLLTGMNSVYHTKDHRIWLQKRMICIFYTVVFIFIVLGALLLLVFGNRLQTFLISLFPILQEAGWMITMLRNMLMLVVMVVFFMLLYYTFPDRKAHFLDQLPGAVFASLGWVLFSYAFSLYIDNFGNYSYMYGSLTAVVLSMLWLYICMHIIFIGGEINAILIEKGVIRQIKTYDPSMDPEEEIKL